MSAALIHEPLVGRVLPASGLPRWLTMGVLAVLGTLILWASAKIQVPFWPVPMTLQTLAVAGIAAACGLRLGLATILLYLAEGAIGLPVFAGTPERGLGLLYMMGPTGGYLLGYAAMAAIIGWAAERGALMRPLVLFAAMLAADALMLFLGFSWLACGVPGIGAEKAFSAGVAPFLLGDLVKMALAAALVPAAGRLLRR